MTRHLVLGALLSAASAAVPVAIAAMPPAQAWEIGPVLRGRNYSVGMPAQPDAVPGGGVAFDFPRAGGEIDAMTTGVRPLAGVRQITLRYRIDAAKGTRFVPAEAPGETATVSLYFQQGGDNWTGRGRYGSYRWYAPGQAVIPLAPGTRTVTIRLDDRWTNVNGVPNTHDPQGFAGALEGTARLGIAFGTTSARSHGVYATGPARFTLLGTDLN
ncbi:MAG: hypothetical protein ACEQR8_09120 [Cypionkella sp.]